MTLVSVLLTHMSKYVQKPFCFPLYQFHVSSKVRSQITKTFSSLSLYQKEKERKGQKDNTNSTSQQYITANHLLSHNYFGQPHGYKLHHS